MCEKKRFVIVGGAEIVNYRKIRSHLRGYDFIVYCDSGVRHMERLGAAPSLIIGDWDSYDDPYLDVETMQLIAAQMYIDGYTVKLVSDTSYGSLWNVSFMLKEF